MTDPRIRRPTFWRTLAWMFAGVSLLNLACGVVLIALGTPTGWVNVAIGVIFGGQALLYARHYRRGRASVRAKSEP